MLRKRLLISAALLLCLTWLVAAGPRQAGWQAVDDAIKQGLPKTAIGHLEQIASKATKAENYDEAVKAVCLRIALEGNVQGNKPEEKISRLESAIANSPAEMQPAMNAVLANWYWQYFQQNRWRFMQRTQLDASGESDTDFTTWSLPRILQQIGEQFRTALSAEAMLKKTPVQQYDELLEKGTAPDSYRPTLFDVLAHGALDFYSAGEQAATQEVDAFDLSADSPIVAGAEEFLNWKPKTDDKDSLKLHAIELYQTLMRFHHDDPDRSAFLDVDLLRLVFGHNHANGSEKSSRYKAALQRFANSHARHPISARALHHLATVLQSEDELVQAHKIANEGLARHSESIGGSRCFNLIQQIEARSSQISTERVWTEPAPSIEVTYRNLTKVYFRLVPFSFDEYVQSARWSPEQLNQDERQKLLRQPSVKQWSADLPKTADYQERTESLPIPQKVSPGSYFLISSHNPNFTQDDNQVSITEVWVSKLAVVLRNHHGDGLVDGFVLDANSGDPIAGAHVKIWQRDRQTNRLVLLDPTKTDRNGLFKFRGDEHRELQFFITHKKQSLSSSSRLSIYDNHRGNQASEQTLFFTDRAIYRPGQTIHFKGICHAFRHQDDNYQTIPRRQLTVVFSDVNGKEIEKMTIRTNDYGSFSGSVTAPRDRLMGRMSLRVQGGPSGVTSVTVEEYKRPKFIVEIDPPKVAAKLGHEVVVTGKATAYTGAPIDGAKVSWRVVRRVRYPIWWYWRCWWMPPGGGASQEIAHGTATTDSGGAFKIEFVAKPDPSVSEESEPTFLYEVSADVTDTTGETRSDVRSVRAGYTALAASMSADDWQTEQEPVEIAIRTTTLDGEGLATKGTVKIYRVKQPDQVTRAPLASHRFRGRADVEPEPDPSNPNSWPVGEVVFNAEFETNASGSTKLIHDLVAGMYRAKLETTDRFGKAVSAELPLRVLDPEAKMLNLKIPNLFASPKQSAEPGEVFLAVWGSGYETARAFIEIEHRGKVIKQFWTEPAATQVAIRQQVDESMRGGFTVRTTMVRENRAYMESQRVNVPWTNKDLKLVWERFVSKLQPGAKETWTAIISGPDADRAAAEMVATLYDASLDAYLPHHWSSGFSVFRQDRSNVHSTFENGWKSLSSIYHDWNVQHRNDTLTYRHFPSQIIQDLWRFHFGRNRSRSNRSYSADAPAFAEEMQADAMSAAPMSMMAKEGNAELSAVIASDDESGQDDKNSFVDSTTKADLNSVAARKNLDETAFFFPHLIAGEDGTVRIDFTMPEALTEWKFLGFAHDQDLRSGLLSGTTVTAKDLMVQPNPPRFLREGDVVEFTVKVINQSPTRQTGTVRLSFAEARTGDRADKRLSNDETDKSFDIAAGESKSLAWRIRVPDNLGFLTYKAVGSTGKLSDGEEGFLPVLSRRVLVRESLPLPIRGKQTKAFEFTKLLRAGDSDSLEHQSLTVQMVSNSSWYAVMALPYLMEYPHQCSEQTFNRFYANSLARHIAASDPKIHRVFEQWRATPALNSPLDKNQDLKTVMIEETPWVRQVDSESQARRNVGILFDNNRLDDESTQALNKLTQMQLPDGAWSWFPGGRANDYITLYITTGFGRMRQLGVQVDTTTAIKSLRRLDGWMTKTYEKIKPKDRQLNHLSTTIAFYLYGRSFFLKDQVVAAEHAEAVEYWLSQAREHWLTLGHRQSQAHLAVALKRFGDLKSAQGIMKSLKERSVSEEELGMFWREDELSWWWYRAPIETQAMMIEAFDEVMNDAAAVEDCKVWLLKQKQTQDWKTTKATADAVYALLLRGSDLLASDELVEVTLGDQKIEPESVEAGTGFYEQKFVRSEVQSAMGEISVKKVDDGVAWGSVHWQYLEDISKIKPHEGTPLKLTKHLFVKKNTDKGPTLVPVTGPIEVGDELIVRIVLRTDRDMEYVHLKDHRGSGTEPVNVLSRYKFQDGLAYYESTRDTASHFFIDYLPKGTYVFEYSTRVQLRGEYQTGFANIQCMYAPEFASHSESLPLNVQ